MDVTRLFMSFICVTAASTSQAQSVTGTWSQAGTADAGRRLQTIQSGNKVRFQLELSRGAPSYNSGFIEGQFDLHANRGVFYRAGDGGCEITFVFQPKKVVLAQAPEKGECGFGYAVHANGELSLRSTAKPSFSGGDPRVSAPQSLCKPGEKTYFACPAKGGRIVALCGAPSLEKGAGYLQYRYGSTERLELAYPPYKAGSLEKFRFAHYSRYRNEQVQVSFSNAGFNYAVFTHADGESTPPVDEQGVLVSNEKQPGKETRVLCTRPAEQILTELESVLPCDEGNALASCN